MREFFVEDISKCFNEVVKVEAKTPIEAVKKVYPDYEVKRNYANTGNIVVGGWIVTRNSKAYRRYIYELKRRQTNG